MFSTHKEKCSKILTQQGQYSHQRMQVSTKCLQSTYNNPVNLTVYFILTVMERKTWTKTKALFEQNCM